MLTSVAAAMRGDARDVAAEADHGEVDDGVDAAGLELVEPTIASASRWPVADAFGVVLVDLGDSTKTCSCINVTPRSAVSISPRTVLSCGTPLMLEQPVASTMSSSSHSR